MKIFILILGTYGLSMVISGCISTHTLNAVLANQQKFEAPLIFQNLNSPIPIEITVENELRNKTEATVAMVTIIPLIIYNEFEVNHRIFLGQSSLPISMSEDLKQKLNEALLYSGSPLVKNLKEGYHLTINVKTIEVYGAYLSGWWGFFFGYGYTGAGHAERIHLSKNARSEITYSLQLYQNDSTLFTKEKSLRIQNSYLHTWCKGKYTDIITAESIPIHPYEMDDLYEMHVSQIDGGSKKENAQLPFIQNHLVKVYEVYQLSLTEIAQKIVLELENYFIQKYQLSNTLNLNQLK